jgi:hypothetical protein
MSTPIVETNAYEDSRALVNLLDHVLEVITSRYEQAGVDLPERRYWTLGTPAADCEQLVVSLSLLFIGGPGDQATSPVMCESPRSTTLAIQVLRCIPTAGQRGNAPSAEKIQAASELMAMDSWLLLDSASDCDSWGLGVIATVTAGEAEGGFQGPTMTLTLAVP